jgi:hypothetical protein
MLSLVPCNAISPFPDPGCRRTCSPHLIIPRSFISFPAVGALEISCSSGSHRHHTHSPAEGSPLRQMSAFALLFDLILYIPFTGLEKCSVVDNCRDRHVRRFRQAGYHASR